jgi:hypothetical protein
LEEGKREKETHINKFIDIASEVIESSEKIALNLFMPVASPIINEAIDIPSRLSQKLKHLKLALKKLKQINLPPLKTGSHILESIHRVAQAVSYGELSPAEGDCLTRTIERQVKVIEMNDFKERLKKLEENCMV